MRPGKHSDLVQPYRGRNIQASSMPISQSKIKIRVSGSTGHRRSHEVIVPCIQDHNRRTNFASSSLMKGNADQNYLTPRVDHSRALRKHHLPVRRRQRNWRRSTLANLDLRCRIAESPEHANPQAIPGRCRQERECSFDRQASLRILWLSRHRVSTPIIPQSRGGIARTEVTSSTPPPSSAPA